MSYWTIENISADFVYLPLYGAKLLLQEPLSFMALGHYSHEVISPHRDYCVGLEEVVEGAASPTLTVGKTSSKQLFRTVALRRKGV